MQDSQRSYWWVALQLAVLALVLAVVGPAEPAGAAVVDPQVQATYLGRLDECKLYRLSDGALVVTSDSRTLLISRGTPAVCAVAYAR